uniref:Cation efflux protein cytoplasmic domain-containing protein n=1 Tax=Trichuris muris TaxID=70415 RepID=A0A5S6PZF1_TRIMR
MFRDLISSYERKFDEVRNEVLANLVQYSFGDTDLVRLADWKKRKPKCDLPRSVPGPSPLLQQVETVLAYHFGHKYLIDVHIILDANASLKQAHDISEPLQLKIERLPFVERSFVHVDYECCH